MKYDVIKKLLSLGLWTIINISCTIFVMWKTFLCATRYWDRPQGTKLDIEDSSLYPINFPGVTICATDKNIRWNSSHLSHCGIARYSINVELEIYLLKMLQISTFFPKEVTQIFVARSVGLLRCYMPTERACTTAVFFRKAMLESHFYRLFITDIISLVFST